MFGYFSLNGEIVQCNLRKYVSLVAKNSLTFNRLQWLSTVERCSCHTCWGLNSHWFPVVGNHHQTIVGIYIHLLSGFPMTRVWWPQSQNAYILVGSYCCWFVEIRFHISYIPLFIRFHTCQVVIAGFLNHQQPWLFTCQVGWFPTSDPKVLDSISGEVNGHRGRRPEIGTHKRLEGGMWEEKRK